MIIAIDNTSDILSEDCKKYNLLSLPCGISYKDKDLLVNAYTHEEYKENLYEYLNEGGIPKTFRDLGSWVDIISEEIKKDDILFISTSIKIAGDIKTANLVKNLVGEISNHKFIPFDTGMSSSGVRACTFRAVELRNKGFSLDEVISDLNDFKKKVHFIFTCESSDYLNSYGKIYGDRTVKDWPIIDTIDDKMTFISKNDSFEKAVDGILKRNSKYSKVITTYTEDCPEEHKDYILKNFHNVEMTPASLSILTVAGLGTFTFAFIND